MQFLELQELPARPAACWRIRREHVWDALERPWHYIADPTRIELPPFTLLAPYPLSSRDGSQEPNDEEESRPKHAPEQGVESGTSTGR
jgi:hypothetical protein